MSTKVVLSALLHMAYSTSTFNHRSFSELRQQERLRTILTVFRVIVILAGHHLKKTAPRRCFSWGVHAMSFSKY
ncbi:hypothetical protein PEC331060_09990 [Pectobacterium carotovorum subsp. carotovorum]|nr:hypothetical protein PEC331060_09990 [Pectobacterium carotovorum subsp. carotovorum]